MNVICLLKFSSESIVEKGKNFSSYLQYFFLMLDFFFKRRTKFSLREKRFFEIIEVEITRVDYISNLRFTKILCPMVCTAAHSHHQRSNHDHRRYTYVFTLTKCMVNRDLQPPFHMCCHLQMKVNITIH